MNQQEKEFVVSRFFPHSSGVAMLILVSMLLAPNVPRAEPDEPMVEANNGARLEFSPPRLRYCGLPVNRTRITVSWDASAMGVNRTRVYLNGPDGQLFASGGAVGESQTGEWVTNGMKFVLYSPELDQVLAEKSFRLIPCNTKEYPDEVPAEP